jgi:predicted permease
VALDVWLGNRAADLRYALRMIRKTPGASAIAVISLALGIGANTAIFSLVDTMLLKQLPVRSPQELFLCSSAPPPRPVQSWNYPDYCALRDRNRSFSGLAAASWNAMTVGMQLADGNAATSAELTQALIVTGNYFQVLGVTPALGRLFNTEEDRAPGASPYAVLSFDYWQSRFSADPRVVGRKVRLNGYPFTVIGVARKGFRSTDVSVGPNFYVPVMMRSEITGVPFPRWNSRYNFWMLTVGRIKPGVNLKQAEAELTVIYKAQEDTERRTATDQRFVNKSSPVFLVPAARGYSMLRNRLEKPLLVLMVVVGLVLLIACANVANLMLARGAARQREIAVRLAMGATRGRLTAQLVTESMVLALLGGAAGLAVCWAGLNVLLKYLPQPGYTRLSLEIAPDARLLAFAAAVSLLTSILFGLAPALASTRPGLVTALKADTPGSGGSRFGLRNVLVVVQVALSLLLVIGAGLFVRSLGQLGALDAGFRRGNTTIAMVEPGRNGYKGQRLRNFYQRLLAETEMLPGVRSAALAVVTPLSGSFLNGNFAVEGYAPKGSDPKYMDMNMVGPRFFETMGIAVVAGREFRDEDNPAASEDPPETLDPQRRPPLAGPRVAIISRGMAQRFFAGRNPIGSHLCLDEKYDPARAFEIVGVVADAHYSGLRERTQPMIYVPVWRLDASSRALCVRTAGDAAGLGDALRRVLARIDPALPLLSTHTMQQQIDDNILQERLLTTLSSFFGGLALLLAAVGLYGVVSYSVTRRTREIGIRMALGAERAQVVRLVARQAFALALLGAVIGVPSALALARVVKSFLFGITAQDPLAIVLATLTLAAAAALASLVPALRAARVDPMTALRHD